MTVLIIIAIILKVKLVKEKKAENSIDFPGADELDKAIAEHQELSDWDEMDDIDNMDESDSFEDANYWQQNDDNNNEYDNNGNVDLDNELDHTDTNYLEEIARSRKYDIDYQDDFNDKPKKKGRGKHF